jgi:phosphate/sulfate permease
MFGLDTGLTILLIVCLIAACGFEFVNGFHDTANAVATVIYTKSLKPGVAVVLAAFFNFIGVFAGGIAVAMGIVNLLPVESLIDQDIYNSLAMVLALLVSAILWNLGTWYFGIPCSSSHTLIGSILGVGIAFSLLPANTYGAAVNWGKASEIGLSLLISPIFGFMMALLLMFLLKKLVKNDLIFQEPQGNKPPPFWIRAILFSTCSLVSFSHGSNDGQKGVGLVMLILIGIVPAYFALDREKDTTQILPYAQEVRMLVSKIDTTKVSAAHIGNMRHVTSSVNTLEGVLTGKMETAPTSSDLSRDEHTGTKVLGGIALSNADHFKVRKDILIISREMKQLMKSEKEMLSPEDTKALKNNIEELRTYTDYAPFWVIFMISLSLGLGTMVGWKRIVVTIGEKIGKSHMTYAQGASAELIAASTIGVSTWLGLPVSTTHVLSSGIAGTMAAGGRGLKNLQAKTIKTIALAWVLTLPVTVILSGSLYLLFRWMF